MEKPGGEESGSASSPKQVALASLIGTSIEWYDFFIYGTAAALVFNALFFPGFDPLTGTLLAFSTFTIGFVARPIGGVIFGHFGDRIGRKAMLVTTLLLMGGATFLIGCLPTYAAIGVGAPLLLVALRLIQGLALGGEWGGAVLMAIEHAPGARRGFYGSFPQMGVPIGLILATLVFLPLAALPEQQFLSWGWRVPFMLSILLVVVGLVIRLKIAESPVFQRIKEGNVVSRTPIAEVLKAHPKQVLLVAGAYISSGIFFYLLVVFNLGYATQELGLERSTMLIIVLISTLLGLMVIPASGVLSDTFGRRPLFLIGEVVIALLAFPIFWVLDTKAFVLILVGYTVGTIAYSIPLAMMASFFSELFGTRVRYSGVSLGYTLGTILGSSLAPLIAAALLARTGSTVSVSIYIIATAVISFVCVLVLSETYQRNIEETEEVQPMKVGERQTT
jgi:metabolite-proton symporter